MNGDPVHTRKFSGKGRPFGTHQPHGNEGGLEEINRRQAAEIANETFVKALREARQEDLRTALLIECEIHRVPNSEELTAYEKAMARVAAGASISIVVPFNRRADPSMTLGGVGSSWMA